VSEGDFVAAVDVGGTKVAVATAALDGEILAARRLDTEAARGAGQVVERALAGARELIGSTVAERRGACAAVGAVCPGIPLADRVVLTPNIPGWDDVALERTVRDGLGIGAVKVRNDVKAAGEAEARWGALAGADPGVYLNLGTGIAAAIVLGRRALDGAHGASGEIAYAVRGPDALRAYADGHAPLEEIAGGRFIGERASRVAGRTVSAREAFASDAPAVVALVDETLAELAAHVANLALVIDPARIAVGGGLMGSSERVLGALRAHVQRVVPFPPEVVAARFIDDAGLRGAVALGLDAAAGR
jgi:predicted NBD/HSP70 family sugar kinase